MAFLLPTSSRRLLLAAAFVFALTGYATPPDPAPAEPSLAFTVAGDMRSFTENTKADGRRFFDGACEAMQRVGPGAFLMSPGDFDPPAANRAIIDRYLGKDFPWYIIVGNHDVENAAVMPWVREWLASAIPHVVRRGLPGTQLTLYSWDIGEAHFVAIDSYPWAVAGSPGNKGKIDLTDATFRWIDEDLAATKKPFRWVIGHQPIESIPDMDSGRVRHDKDSVSQDPARAQRFVELLKKHRVSAYICGHSHNTSVVKLKSGLWQADTGHARGGGDTGSPSSFLKFRIVGNAPLVDIYRADPSGRDYRLRQTVELK
jgi:3',5'-cyclic AMP phosphodiesterase CpdA